jgi:hypothetical protein
LREGIDGHAPRRAPSKPSATRSAPRVAQTKYVFEHSITRARPPRVAQTKSAGARARPGRSSAGEDFRRSEPQKRLFSLTLNEKEPTVLSLLAKEL